MHVCLHVFSEPLFDIFFKSSHVASLCNAVGET